MQVGSKKEPMLKKYVFSIKFNDGCELGNVVLKGKYPSQIVNVLQDADSVVTCDSHYINLDNVRYIKYEGTFENKKKQAEETAKNFKHLVNFFKKINEQE